MPLEKRGKFYYGDRQSDIREELLRYSKANAYPAHCFADVACRCTGRLFQLLLDDVEGVAVRRCVRCEYEHPIGDSAEYLEEAELEECGCPCGAEKFEITVALSLYEEGEDARWVYIGCRCPKCGLTAVYGDWKNEFNGYREYLEKV